MSFSEAITTKRHKGQHQRKMTRANERSSHDLLEERSRGAMRTMMAMCRYVTPAVGASEQQFYTNPSSRLPLRRATPRDLFDGIAASELLFTTASASEVDASDYNDQADEPPLDLETVRSEVKQACAIFKLFSFARVAAPAWIMLSGRMGGMLAHGAAAEDQEWRNVWVDIRDALRPCDLERIDGQLHDVIRLVATHYEERQASESVPADESDNACRSFDDGNELSDVGHELSVHNLSLVGQIWRNIKTLLVGWPIR